MSETDRKLQLVSLSLYIRFFSEFLMNVSCKIVMKKRLENQDIKPTSLLGWSIKGKCLAAEVSQTLS